MAKKAAAPKAPKRSKQAKKVIAHLEKAGMKFDIVTHRKVYTAYDLAQTMGEKLDDIAKSLLVKVEIPTVQKKGNHYFVLVLPATAHVDFAKLKKTLKAKKAELAPEKLMKKLDLEPGAVSPFGSIRDIEVVMDKGVAKLKKVIVGAESHTESIKMALKDLVKLESPLIAAIGKKNTLKLQKKAAPKKKPKKGKGRVAAKKAKAKKVAAKKKIVAKKPAKKVVKKPAKKPAKKAAAKKKR